MHMIDERLLEQQEKEWLKEKELVKRKQKLKNEKRQLKGKKKITTTKLLIGFLFLNCTIVELFTGWTTIENLRVAAVIGLSPDFSPLATLIGAVVGEVLGFAIYSLKSAKENCEGGIVYMNAKNNNDNETEE